MGEPEKVRLETRLTDAEIVETVAYAQEKELGPGWVRSQLRQNQAHRPRAPDDGNSIICPVCHQHPCACEEEA